MTSHEQVATFISRRVTVGRVRPGATYYPRAYFPSSYHGPALPSAEQIGEAFFADAEFRALQLGGFLNTPSGHFLEQALELLIPRTLAPEFDLIVAELKYAASRQQGQARGTAVLAVGGGLLFGLLVRELGKAA